MIKNDAQNYKLSRTDSLEQKKNDKNGFFAPISLLLWQKIKRANSCAEVIDKLRRSLFVNGKITGEIKVAAVES